MTNEEAKEMLHNERVAIFYRYPAMNEAVKLAISALEKQTPKKPKVLKVQEVSGYKFGGCECGEHIMDDEKYCSNCGQAIDWSDTE